MRRLFILGLVVIAVTAVACTGETSDPSTSTTRVTTTDGATTTVDLVPTTAPPETTSSSSTVATTTTTTTPATTTLSPPTTEKPDDRIGIVAVEVADGEVVGGVRTVDVARGSVVELVVSADVVDEVHVHGYDEKGDVAPGSPASITFTANIPGIFEVELEGSGLLVVELRVS